MTVSIPEEAREAAIQACMAVRDTAPRHFEDADSEDVVDAIFNASAHLIIAAELERLGNGAAWGNGISVTALMIRYCELRGKES